MRERFCSLFKCYSLYCFGLLYKNRKKQIAVLQKNDLPITIHFSPPNVYSKNLIFCTFRALCWDVRRPMIHFSCTIFREKSLEFRIYVSLTNKISTSSIFYISCSRNFTSLSLFEDVYTTFGGYFSCSGEPKSDSSRTRIRPELSVHHYFLGSSFLSRDRRSSSNNHFYF